MNWTTFNTHQMSPDKAFEILCNQLFENWCKSEYVGLISSFAVVNGSGGDGGVESYLTLNDGKIIGLQAKWFPSSIDSSAISQIRNSIETAIRVRPNIIRYIVCVPRDLASKTARTLKSGNSEDNRWNALVQEMSTEFPMLEVELWNETKITEELQKADCSGICRFWFENSEISLESVKYAFDRAKCSWLSNKYVPELNMCGKIDKILSDFLGDEIEREALLSSFHMICKHCEEYKKASVDFLSICKGKDEELKSILISTGEKLEDLYVQCERICWLLSGEKSFFNVDDDVHCYINFDSIIERIQHNQQAFHHHFHSSEVTKALRRLSKYDVNALLEKVKAGCETRSILFLGNPGTGKTHGIAAFADKLFEKGLHVPLVIRAMDIPSSFGWRDIIVKNLGLSSIWSEEQLLQALCSLANRNRFNGVYLNSKIKVVPKILIVVDGIDESIPHSRWEERIREAKLISAKYQQIRFCFTTRPTAIPNPQREFVKHYHLSNSGDVLTKDLFDDYMHAYNVNAQNRGWLKSALITPLSLKLFCEINKNKSVTISERSEVSMTTLWRQQIDKVETEFGEKYSIDSRNQYILQAIVLLSNMFLTESVLDRDLILSAFNSKLGLSEDRSEQLLYCLENYGILSCSCERGNGLNPDKYKYFHGIQGYFDYATSSLLLKQFGHPKDIDFSKCKGVSLNVLNGLAVISMQKYDYLITRNSTIKEVLYLDEFEELQFFALVHTNHKNAIQFVERSREIMNENADGLITIANRVVLPLAKDIGHPLGVNLLDDFLSQFERPAQRDILWSIPGYLKDSYGKRWNQPDSFALEEEEYNLDSEDTFEGVPTIYAWALSSVNNSFRRLYRDRLMVWARSVPQEFYKLFLKFSNVNDPQIRADLFSILMCLVHDIKDTDLLDKATRWIMENILHPSKIDLNRDIAIRYYSIAIVKKAIYEKLITEDECKDCLPPYQVKTNDISLNKEALAGTRMNGYKAIDYDLSRYVLVDHFLSDFSSYTNKKSKGQILNLIACIAKDHPEYLGITEEQFFISMAYAYILEMGWNEEEFYNFEKDDAGNDIIGGADIAILRTYHAATHGSKSAVMTVCEKYVWQARNSISGFLCDRLLYGDSGIRITDYGLLDDFVIPSHDLVQIDPDNIPEDRPWHIPEEKSVVLEGDNQSREDVVNSVVLAPILDWEKWISVDNPSNKYKVDADNLMALYMFSCFYGSAGVETDIFINSVIVDLAQVDDFIEQLCERAKKYKNVANPMDWNGSIASSCYITPKEICCFPWKTRYDPYIAEDFPTIAITAAVDSCCCNTLDFGDVHYEVPSAMVREYLGIKDTDGYTYIDSQGKVIAEYTLAGEKWRTYQSSLLINRSLLLKKLEKNNKTLVWIMKERRRNSGMTMEKYGRFGVDRMKSFVGYYSNGVFTVKEIISDLESY
ncbi:MAG: hypothetical protein IJF14_01885 [Clostridia bacterium]|nr:hypothetical protein [Clostridia bacterium]